ncbi:DMT family transporter [Kocuria tytonis]|uniref:QacE family quaternary ammonium compound efflux SMR transporter n=1 Tax=Kocuria tytonis TaxID=2054280 RepID=A0A495A6E0_9MICC|nr:SMR family transporter [Kocuria tytonis]RKQ35300.1 QacE family quaternary ammonium compound efflux SMR transporter [Kocuria tytonis]
MQKWLFLMAAITSEVTGSLALKAAVAIPVFYALVVAGYAGSFLGLFASLRHGMTLGVGYGIWGATGVAATAVMSFLIFGEPITPVMGAGLVLVMAGVLLVELGSQAAQKRSRAAAESAGAAR